MLRVGLTGGIASGKTTVAGMFEALGAGIVDTDAIAREVVAPGEPGLTAVVAAFGPSVLLESGELDRAALRRIVFRDAERRAQLESLLHPAIRARALERLADLDAPYAVLVVPLLLETGLETLVERIAVVDCPRALQLARLRERDAISDEDATAMLQAQIGRTARLARADDVIDNSGSLERTHGQVRALHARYLDMAGGRLPK